MKQGQVEHPINWILVLFAGAFFLLIFISIAKFVIDTGGSERDALTINTLSNLIERSKANPESKVAVTLPQMQAFCNGDYTVQSGRQERTFMTHPVFSPSELDGDALLWSEEYRMLNPVTTFTYLFPNDTVYVFDPAMPQRIIQEFESLPKRILAANALSDNDFGGYERAVIITNAGFINPLQSDKELHLLEVSLGNQITFYTHDGNNFLTPEPRPYHGDEMLYGAIASGNVKGFDCALTRASKQAMFQAEIAIQRINILYENSASEPCKQKYVVANATYNQILTAGIGVAKTAEPILTSANSFLANNGCPNI